MDVSLVQCAMLYGLEPGLQRRFERHGAYEMFQELKLIFQANARIERYDVWVFDTGSVANICNSK